MENSRRRFVINVGILSGGLLLGSRVNNLIFDYCSDNNPGRYWTAFCDRLGIGSAARELPSPDNYLVPVAGQSFEKGMAVFLNLEHCPEVFARPVWVHWPGFSSRPADLLVQVFNADGQYLLTLNRYEIEFLSGLNTDKLPAVFSRYLEPRTAAGIKTRDMVTARVGRNNRVNVTMPLPALA